MRGSARVAAAGTWPTNTSEPKPISVPFASLAVRAVTIVCAIFSFDTGPSCQERTQPGYPRRSSGEGWSGTAMCVQPPRRSSTCTCSP